MLYINIICNLHCINGVSILSHYTHRTRVFNFFIIKKKYIILSHHNNYQTSNVSFKQLKILKKKCLKFNISTITPKLEIKYRIQLIIFESRKKRTVEYFFLLL